MQRSDVRRNRRYVSVPGRRPAVGISTAFLVALAGFGGIVSVAPTAAAQGGPWDSLESAITYMAAHCPHATCYDRPTYTYHWSFTDAADAARADDLIQDLLLVEYYRDQHKDDTALKAAVSLLDPEKAEAGETAYETVATSVDVASFFVNHFLKRPSFLEKMFKPLQEHFPDKVDHELVQDAVAGIHEWADKLGPKLKQANDLTDPSFGLEFTAHSSKGLQLEIGFSLRALADSVVKHVVTWNAIAADGSISEVVKGHEAWVETLRAIFEFFRDVVSSAVSSFAAKQAATLLLAGTIAAAGPLALVIAGVGYVATEYAVQGIVSAALNGLFEATIDNPTYKLLEKASIPVDLFRVRVGQVADEGGDRFVPYGVGGGERLTLTVENTGARIINLRATPGPDPTGWSVKDLNGLDLDNYEQVTVAPKGIATLQFRVTSGYQPSFLSDRWQPGVNPATLTFRLEHDRSTALWDMLDWGNDDLTTVETTLYNVRTAVLDVAATAAQPAYARGETASVNLRITNVGSDTGSFVLRVRFRYVGDDDSSAYAGTVPPEPITLKRGEAREVPTSALISAAATAGMHQVSVDASWGQGFYPDNLAWTDVFLVAQPSVRVVAPSSASPAPAGSYLRPLPMLDVRAALTDAATARPLTGLGVTNFHVTIGQETAAAALVLYDAHSQSYLLRVKVPAQTNPGDFDLRVELVLHGQAIGDATSLAAVHYSADQTTNVDVVLVIDRSGSMSGAKMDAAISSAKQFVEFMSDGDMIGVVDFDNRVNVTFSLAVISGPASRAGAEAAIDTLYARGGTSIGGGLQGAGTQLSQLGRAGIPRAIVLMTDGQETSSPYVSSIMPAIVSADVRVFTIGLGADVNPSLLADVAAQTGGSYHFSPSNLDLQGIYNAIAGVIRGESTVASFAGTIDPGESISHDVYVDASMSRVVFSSAVAGSELAFAVRSPWGELVDEATASAHPGATFREIGTYKALAIEDPTPGTWELLVGGLDVAYGEAYSAQVQGQAAVTLTLATDRESYALNEPVQILASVASSEVLLGRARVVAEAKKPSAQTETVPLFDDGRHGDLDAGDGVFGALYAGTSGAGSYSFRVRAESLHESGLRFAREAEKSVSVSGYASTQRLTPKLSLYSASATPYGEAHFDIDYTAQGTGTAWLSATDLVAASTNGTVAASSLRLSRSAIDMEGTTQGRITVDVAVPPSAAPDTYAGAILVMGAASQRIPLQLVVTPLLIQSMPALLDIGRLDAGDRHETTVRINTTGSGTVSNLRVTPIGDIAEWLSVEADGAVLASGRTVEVSVELDIPGDAPAGNYSGSIVVTGDGLVAYSIPIQVSVFEGRGTPSMLAGWGIWVAAALGSVLAGGVSFAVTRRRLRADAGLGPDSPPARPVESWLLVPADGMEPGGPTSAAGKGAPRKRPPKRRRTQKYSKRHR